MTHTLRAEGFDASEDGTGRGTPLVPVLSHALTATATATATGRLDPNGETFIPIAFAQNQRDEVRDLNNVAGAIAAEPGMKQQTVQATASRYGVRRLTPTECERLQGFPDGWTRYGADGSELSDSARYRMLGNAIAVPCVEWFIRRIAASESIS